MAGPRRCEPGGILGLLDLIEEHPKPLAYDFRSRFRCGLGAMPDEIDWAEGVQLVEVLTADPSSALAAALQGWDHPISREALLLADLYDLNHTVAAGGKKVTPHPARPKTDAKPERYGNAAGRTPDEVKAILRAARDGEL